VGIVLLPDTVAILECLDIQESRDIVDFLDIADILENLGIVGILLQVIQGIADIFYKQDSPPEILQVLYGLIPLV